MLFWLNEVPDFFLFINDRTPFGQNTATRCAAVVLFEALVVVCIVSLICTMTGLFLGSMIYVKACFLDIKSIYLQVNRLSKCKKSEWCLVESCKDATDIHDRVNRYSILHSINFPIIPDSPVLLLFRLMYQLAELTNMIIFMMITPFTLCICFCMFLIAKVRN